MRIQKATSQDGDRSAATLDGLLSVGNFCRRDSIVNGANKCVFLLFHKNIQGRIIQRLSQKKVDRHSRDSCIFFLISHPELIAACCHPFQVFSFDKLMFRTASGEVL